MIYRMKSQRMEEEEGGEYSWPWRMIPRRHSMEDHHHRRSSNRLVINSLHDEDGPVVHRDRALDFCDVFGGPPLTAMPSGHSSSDFGVAATGSTSGCRSTNAFYGDIFCNRARRHADRRRRAEGERRGGIYLDDDSRRTRNHSSNSTGRNLPGFNIPPWLSSAAMAAVPKRTTSSKTGLFTEEGFYDDIFGSQHGGLGSRDDANQRICCRCKTRLKSKSKSNTSSSSTLSVLSSEVMQSQSDLRSTANNNPLLAAAHQQNRRGEEDELFSAFASKLRPITIPTRTMHHKSLPPSTLSGSDGESNSRGHRETSKIDPEFSSFIDLLSSPDIKRSSSYIDADFFQRYDYTKPPCNDWNHRQHFVNESVNVSKDSCAVVSPSSVTSSVFLELLPATNASAENNIMEKVVVLQEDEGNKEASSEGSFIIEIDSNPHRVKSMGETEGAAALDEAIAWAKEKFWNKQLASDTTRSVGMENDETVAFCISSNDANGDPILIDAKLNSSQPTG